MPGPPFLAATCCWRGAVPLEIAPGLEEPLGEGGGSCREAVFTAATGGSAGRRPIKLASALPNPAPSSLLQMKLWAVVLLVGVASAALPTAADRKLLMPESGMVTVLKRVVLNEAAAAELVANGKAILDGLAYYPDAFWHRMPEGQYFVAAFSKEIPAGQYQLSMFAEAGRQCFQVVAKRRSLLDTPEKLEKN